MGRQAVEYIDRLLTKDAVVGVGTGSTTNYFIDALAGVKHKFNGAVSSSEASTQRLLEHGIPVFELNDVNELIVYVDGADEANDRLQLIKVAAVRIPGRRLLPVAPKSLFVSWINQN